MVYHKSSPRLDYKYRGMFTACNRLLEYPIQNIRRCWKHVTCKSCLKKRSANG